MHSLSAVSSRSGKCHDGTSHCCGSGGVRQFTRLSQIDSERADVSPPCQSDVNEQNEAEWALERRTNTLDLRPTLAVDLSNGHTRPTPLSVIRQREPTWAAESHSAPFHLLSTGERSYGTGSLLRLWRCSSILRAIAIPPFYKS